MPAPEVGKLLPRGDEAYVVESKLDYVLSDKGHGSEWRRVFRVEPSQSRAFWDALAELAAGALVGDVRPTDFGVRCETRTELTFNRRTATVVLGWWYDEPGDRPRLVTVYPTP